VLSLVPRLSNVELPAFAAERRLQAYQLSSKPDTPLLLSINGTDGRTDGHPTVA